MAVKMLGVFEARYGQALFKGNELIEYIHENEGIIPVLTLESIMEAFGIEVEVLESLTKTQAKELAQVEDADLDAIEEADDDDDFDDDETD